MKTTTANPLGTVTEFRGKYEWQGNPPENSKKKKKGCEK